MILKFLKQPKKSQKKKIRKAFTTKAKHFPKTIITNVSKKVYMLLHKAQKFHKEQKICKKAKMFLKEENKNVYKKKKKTVYKTYIQVSKTAKKVSKKVNNFC